MSPQDVANMAIKYKAYYKHTGGGVTFSGGEPLMQGRFLTECLELLKEHGIHTAIDTSGYGQEQWFNKILSLADCVLLDIKAMDEGMHQELIGKPINGRAAFFNHLEDFAGALWVRHVMVPGFTDHPKAMDDLYKTLKRIHHHIEKVEILPYHKGGSDKYYRLAMEDLLAQTPAMDKTIAKRFEEQLINRLKQWQDESVRKVS